MTPLAAALVAGACSTANAPVAERPATPTSADGESNETSSTTDTVAVPDEDTARLSSEDAPATTAGPGVLVDVTASIGLDRALAGIRGHAVAAADINGDGWTDVFVGTFADRPIESYQFGGADGPQPDRLLLGGPTGFTVDDRFVGRTGRTAGAHFADLDNDGDPDLIVSRNPRDGDRQQAPTEIHVNRDGVLEPWVVLDPSRGGRAVTTLDVDADGDLDIVLVEDRWRGGSTAIFRNDGELAFVDATAEFGLPTDVFGLGVAVGDLNDDGVADLVVGGSNRWFLGTGGGFVEGAQSPLPWPLPRNEDDAAHPLITDVDGDGRVDIVIGQHFNSTVDFGEPEPVRLWRNDGPGADGQPTFVEITESAGSPPLSTKSPQLIAADLDGDGWDEIVTTATLEGSSTNDRVPYVLHHRATGADGPLFEAPPGTTGPHYWIDAVSLDANRDGRTDLFFIEWEPELGSRLFLNLPEGTSAEDAWP